MFNRISDSMGLLKKALDVAALRNSIIADNIANEDTPGYKRKRVEFESFFNDFIKSGRFDDWKSLQSRVKSITPLIREEKGFSLRKDGNNVSIDVETAEMTMNSIKYAALSQQIQNQFAMLKLVVKETK